MLEVTENKKLFPKYEEYKDSGIDWLGEIPECWKTKPIKRLINNLVTKGEEETLPFLALEHIQSNSGKLVDDFVPEEVLANVYAKFFKGDILFGKLRPYLRKYWQANFNGCCTTEFFVLNPKDHLMSNYLYYYVQTEFFIELTNATSYGVKMPRTSWDKLAPLYMAYPVEETQEKIADYLDKETKKIDNLIEKKQKMIELLKEKRTALISQAVTRGLDPNVKMKDSGIPWLGQIPEYWTTTKLKRLTKTKITDGPHSTPKILEEGVPFISAESIQSHCKIDFSHKRGFISFNDHMEFCKKAKPIFGDIFLVKSGATTGRIARVEEDIEFSIWSPLALIRSDEKIVDNNYLFIFLQSPVFQDQIQFSWSFGTQQNIGMGVIENLIVVLPSLSLQEEIIKYVDHKIKTIDLVKNKIERQIEKIKEYRTALISAAVTGKIKI